VRALRETAQRLAAATRRLGHELGVTVPQEAVSSLAGVEQSLAGVSALLPRLAREASEAVQVPKRPQHAQQHAQQWTHG
jgi:hypothetical protein